MADLGRVFREYMSLEGKRKAGGLSPDELLRWTQCKRLLSQRFQSGPAEAASDRRESIRVPVKLKVSFDSYGEILECLMTNLSQGGLFVATPAPLPIGTKIQLRVRIEEGAHEIELRGEVTSQNTGPDFLREKRGMGVRFVSMTPAQRRLVDELYGEVLRKAVREES